MSKQEHGRVSTIDLSTEICSSRSLYAYPYIPYRAEHGNTVLYISGYEEDNYEDVVNGGKPILLVAKD